MDNQLKSRLQQGLIAVGLLFGLTLLAHVPQAGADNIVIVVPSATPSPTPDPIRTTTQTFGVKSTTGLNGCKTEALSEKALEGLIADCKAWLKDRTTELKDRIRTSGCEPSCSDCSMAGLRRCTVTGNVTYDAR